MDIIQIKSILKQRKINYDKLSEMSGVSKSAIAKILSGEAKNPRYETVLQLERALNISENVPLVSEYLTEDEEKLLETYKNLSDKNKKLVVDLINALSVS